MKTMALAALILLIAIAAPARAGLGDCGQPVSSGTGPIASDCLFTLRVAVGLETCSPACICDTTGAGGATATDALLCLKKAVGQPVELDCPCLGPLGSEFEANTYTTGSQKRPSVAADAEGNFVVVWHSEGSSGSDSAGYSIQAQRFLSTGTAAGSEVQVNSYTTGQQFAARVAADGDGNFIVVWSGAVAGIRAQRFDDSGARVGSEFQVDTYTSAASRGSPSVATDGGGNFVVVWQSFGSSGSDSSNFSVLGQRFDSSGDPAGTEFQVNTYTTDSQSAPSLAVAADGSFVVIWDSEGSSDPDSDFGVQGQRFDTSGDPVGTEFRVNTYTTYNQVFASVAGDGAGNFVVVWQSYGSDGSDSSDFSIQGQRFDDSGDPVGTEFQVNAYTTGIQASPSVATDSGGNFVVVWDSEGSSGSDSGYGIQGQRFDSSGAPVGTEFQVNTYTTSYQFLPSVALGAGGDFVVVWQSDGSSGSDSSEYSVLGQRFE